MKKLFFIYFILFFLFSNIYSQNTWKQIANSKGVVVYSREQANSNYNEIMAITTMNTTVSALVALLMDIESYPDWVYSCEESKLVKKHTENEYSYYTLSDSPWPVQDRDCVVRTKIIKSPFSNTVYTESKCEGGRVAKKDNIVRITVMNASWKFAPIKNNKVKITYQIKIEPGGNIPSWLINELAELAPINSLSNMREMVKKDKYKNAKVDFLE